MALQAECAPSSVMRARVMDLVNRHGAAITAFVIRVASAALVLALQVFLARMLPLDTYGHYVTISTWIIVVAGFAVMGLGESAQRFMPRYSVRERWHDVVSFFHFSLVSAGGLAIIGSFLGLVAAFLLPFEHTTRTIIVLVCLGVPCVVADVVLEGVGRAMGWFKLAIVPTYILQPIAMIVVLGGMVLAGIEIDLITTCTTFISLTAILTCAKAVFVYVRLRAARRDSALEEGQACRDRDARKWRSHWLRASLPLMAVYGMDDFLLYSDVLMLGILSTPEDVGVYIAAVRCLAIANFIHYAFMLVAARKFSITNSQGDRAALQSEVQDTSRVTFLLTVPAVLLTVAAGYPLLAVFGPAFTSAWPIIAILGLGFIVRSSVGQTFDLLAVMGHARAIVWVSVVCLTANVALSVVLIPMWGMMGAAIATMVVMTIRALGLALVTERLTGLSVIAFVSRPLLARKLP